MTTHFSSPVNIVVKASTQEEAEAIVATRLNAWLCEDKDREPPFPTGRLLYWTYMQ